MITTISKMVGMSEFLDLDEADKKIRKHWLIVTVLLWLCIPLIKVAAGGVMYALDLISQVRFLEFFIESLFFIILFCLMYFFAYKRKGNIIFTIIFSIFFVFVSNRIVDYVKVIKGLESISMSNLGYHFWILLMLLLDCWWSWKSYQMRKVNEILRNQSISKLKRFKA